MGGQNHQPTRDVLTPASAWLSQKVSNGFLLVLQANSHLEDAIMIGMDKLHIEDIAADLKGDAGAHVDLACTRLSDCLACLYEISLGFDRLIETAEKIGYPGNPLASSLKSSPLLSQFNGTLVQPEVNNAVWIKLEERISQKNILATLRWEQTEFERVRLPLEQLINVMSRLNEIASTNGARAMVDAIEKNEIPLRQYYAQVFSLWNHLHAMFLYSALIMTELFYRTNGYPSLLEFNPTDNRIEVA